MRHPATIASRSTGSSFRRKTEMKRLSGIVIDWMRLMIAASNGAYSAGHAFRSSGSGLGKGADRILRDAPHLIVAHGRFRLTASANCLHHCALLTWNWPPTPSDSVLAGRVISTPRRTSTSRCSMRFRCRKTISVIGGMMIGYPKNRYHRFPLRNDAKIEWR